MKTPQERAATYLRVVKQISINPHENRGICTYLNDWHLFRGERPEFDELKLDDCGYTFWTEHYSGTYVERVVAANELRQTFLCLCAVLCLDKDFQKQLSGRGK